MLLSSDVGDMLSSLTTVLFLMSAIISTNSLATLFSSCASRGWPSASAQFFCDSSYFQGKNSCVPSRGICSAWSVTSLLTVFGVSEVKCTPMHFFRISSYFFSNHSGISGTVVDAGLTVSPCISGFNRVFASGICLWCPFAFTTDKKGVCGWCGCVVCRFWGLRGGWGLGFRG